MAEDTDGLGGLTAEEQAYFDSRGETAPVAATPEPVEKAAPEIPDDDAALETPEAGDEPEAKAERGDDDRKVPLKALQEERRKRQDLEARVKEHDEFRRKADERLALMEQRFRQEQEPAEPGIPDPDEDVFGTAKALVSKVQGLEQQLKDQSAQAQQTARIQATLSRYKQDAETVKAEAPDFTDAYDYLQKSRAQELQRMGYADPNQVAQMIQQDEFNLVNQAYSRGENPAKIVYDLAQLRGYRKADAAPKASTPDLGKIEEAQKANKSLSNTSGAPTGPMTIERLISMGADEFDAYSSKNPKTVQKLLGA